MGDNYLVSLEFKLSIDGEVADSDKCAKKNGLNMRSCPTCGRDSLQNIEGTRHMTCEACNIVIFHEGNGFVVEVL